MKLRSSLPLAAAAALGLAAAPMAQTTSVQILHASDLEGGVEAVADAPNFAAVVEALEKDAATKKIDSLLLSSGDNYIPGPFFSSAGDFSLRSVFRTLLNNPNAREGEGRADVTVMNIMGFDASAVGNHEFDAGTSAMYGIVGTDIRSATEARWLGAQFPYLSANLDFTGDSNLSGRFTSQLLENTQFQGTLKDLTAAGKAPKFAAATYVKRGSETYGIVGATTPLVQSISSPGGVKVKGPSTNDMAALAAVIQPSIDALTKMGVNKIILVTHLQQFSLEQQLVKLLSGVDVVLAGGSDTILADKTDRLRAGDKATGNYPFVTTNKDNDPALIVSTDGQYKYVGRLVVDFDAKGVLIPASVNEAVSGVFATDSTGVKALWGANDPFGTGTKGGQVKTLTDAVSKVVTTADANIVGRANVWLEGRRSAVRTEETNFGALTAQANLYVAQSFDKSVLVSHKNGGGIRNAIGSIDKGGKTGPNIANPLSGKKAGEVSQLDIQNSLRFNNGLTLITLTRAQMKEVLEHAVAGSGPGNTPGQFGQFAGISFSFDVTRKAGDRVRYAQLTNKSVQDPIVVMDGKVMGTSSIRVVTLDFLAGGGDSYPFPSFVAANATFANQVELTKSSLPGGQFSFAAAGSEQDAMAEYMYAMHKTSAYGERDNEVQDDQRIQQTGTRPSLTSSVLSATKQRFDLSGATKNAPVFFLVGSHAKAENFEFGAFGRITWGVDPIALVFMGNTDAAGALRIDGDKAAGATGLVQALIIDGFAPTKLETSTTETVSF